MELEDLLRRASAAPLGPLAFTFTPLSASKWALTVTMGGSSHPIQAERDAATDGLILTCAIDDSVPALHGLWVTNIVRENSGEAVQLWLHGDGLSPAMLLNALAALVPVMTPESKPADEAVVEMPTIAIPLPPPPNRPPPIPIERPRPVRWNSFSRGESSEPEPVPASTPEASSVTDDKAAGSEDYEVAPDPAVDASSAKDAVVAGAIVSDTAPTPAASPSGLPPEVPISRTDEAQPAGAAGICRECGSPFEPDHAFCTNCGARLN